MTIKAWLWSGLMATPTASYIDGCEDIANEFELMSHGRDFELCNRMGASALYLKRLLKLPWTLECFGFVIF